MNATAQQTPTAATQALDWFVRRRGSLREASEREFQAWRQAPENAAAYAELERTWAAAAEAAEHPDIAEWVDSLDRGVDRRRVGRRAIAAGLAAIVLGVSGFGLYGLVAPRRLVDQAFRTAVGQQATVSLPDGSVITLNTDTVVRTEAAKDRRLVYLDRGQAFFKVAHDRRHPFVVTAAGRTVTALGTAFDVRVDHGSLKVVLVEGKVRVEPVAAEIPHVGAGSGSPAAPARAAVATEMGAGTELVARGDSDWRVTRADVAQETSWLNGKIVIRNEPLELAIAELNRYSDRKMVLDDPSLAQTRVSGVFKPGDLEGFARALGTSGLAQVSGQNDAEVRIGVVK
jgi:transmembrane sensor